MEVEDLDSSGCSERTALVLPWVSQVWGLPHPRQHTHPYVMYMIILLYYTNLFTLRVENLLTAMCKWQKSKAECQSQHTILRCSSTCLIIPVYLTLTLSHVILSHKFIRQMYSRLLVVFSYQTLPPITYILYVCSSIIFRFQIQVFERVV